MSSFDSYRQGKRRREIDSAVDESMKDTPRQPHEPTVVDKALIERVTGVPLTRRAKSGRFGLMFTNPGSPFYIPEDS
jgi:hypothetical protein